MNTERKLATIAVIKDLQPIKDADAIEVATVRGWKVVVKKGEFKVGDLCIYCEIDSVLPARPEFAFLEKSKYRIRTIKLRGQVSQGICFPVDVIEGATTHYGDNDWVLLVDDGQTTGYSPLTEGLDVTEILGVTKYEPPIPAELSGKVKGNFPSFLIKTDEERIQNLEWTEFYEEYKSVRFYTTEKLDGTSSTYYFRDGEFGVCSRNLDLIETENNTFWKIAREWQIEEKMKSLGFNIAVQGEIIGEGIQKNKYRLKGQHLRVFTAFNIDKYQNFNLNEMVDICHNKLDLPIVPIVDSSFKLLPTIDEMLEYANSTSLLNVNIPKEGIVIRPLNEENDTELSRVSFKVISNEFLLKYKN